MIQNIKPSVSVTLAAYNVEEFIKESLDCIVNQTLKDIEIICIDDGSTDNTLSILNEYAQKDNRITVITKPKNEGLAVARNESLALAKGKYIAFVDGDDLMDLDLFKKAYELAEKEKADMVMWDYAVFYNNEDLEENRKKPSTLDQISVDNKVSLLRRPAFTWVKLIKTKVAKALNIHFPDGLTRQDIPVHWHLITKLENISILPEILSYYRQQSNATTHRSDTRLFDLASVMSITEDYLKKNNLFDLYKDIFLESQLNLLFGMYDKADKSIKLKALMIIKEKLGDDQWQYIYGTKPLRWQARMFYLSLEGSLLAKIQYQLWKFTRKLYRAIKGIIK